MSALESFNVFGAIIFVAQEMVITGTAVLKNKKQVSRTRKFPVTFPRKNADEVATFSASIEKNKISYSVSYRSFVIKDIEAQEAFSENEHISSSMKTFLQAMDKAVFLSEDSDRYVDRAVELEELGLSEDEIAKRLDQEFPDDAASQDS